MPPAGPASGAANQVRRRRRPRPRYRRRLRTHPLQTPSHFPPSPRHHRHFQRRPRSVGLQGGRWRGGIAGRLNGGYRTLQSGVSVVKATTYTGAVVIASRECGAHHGSESYQLLAVTVSYHQLPSPTDNIPSSSPPESAARTMAKVVASSSSMWRPTSKAGEKAAASLCVCSP